MRTKAKTKTTKARKQEAVSMGPQQIVIVDRGWVYVGQAEESVDKITIRNARVIRIWGTTAGLGQLAEGGPTPTTKLDPIGTVVAPMRAVISIIACKTAW
jgi:hypothetical protein